MASGSRSNVWNHPNPHNGASPVEPDTAKAQAMSAHDSMKGTIKGPAASDSLASLLTSAHGRDSAASASPDPIAREGGREEEREGGTGEVKRGSENQRQRCVQERLAAAQQGRQEPSNAPPQQLKQHSGHHDYSRVQRQLQPRD